MAKVKIITDSACDISKEDEYRYSIDIMNIYVQLGDLSLIERKSVSNHGFYDMLDKSEVLPTTSPISVSRFEEKFRECAAEGWEDVIVVPINSTGALTYGNALEAKSRLEEEGALGLTRIHVVDSHCYSLGYGYPIIEAARRLEAGMSCEMAIELMEDWFSCCEIYIIGFNLRHMRMSGRISAAAAFVGEMLSIKPVISLIDGKSKVIKKCKGEKAAVLEAADYIAERMIPETPWHILTTTAPDMEELFRKSLAEKVGSGPTLMEECGYAVACNAGSRFIGVVIKGRQRRQ